MCRIEVAYRPLVDTPTRCKELAELGQHVAGVLDHIAPCEDAELVSALPSLTFPLMIRFPGVARVVVAVAVEFCCELLIRPPAVDISSVGGAVHVRQWQPGFDEPARKGLLQQAEDNQGGAAQDAS